MLELLLDAALYAFCAVDMRRPHLPFLGATDASTTFGLGATVAPMSCSDLRRIARLSCKAGGHVMMEGGPSLPERPSRRLGPRHDLGLNLGDFRVVLSIRRGSPDHVNLEEARALIQYVQWILRTRQHFGHRLVVLLDSKVAIGAVTKGRSSSLPLNRLLRRLAALCFVGGLVLHCVFVPTSHNLADWPSRGGPASWPRELRQSSRPRGRPRRLSGCRPLSRMEENLWYDREIARVSARGVSAAHRDRLGRAAQALLAVRPLVVKRLRCLDKDGRGLVPIRAAQRLLAKFVPTPMARVDVAALLAAAGQGTGSLDHAGFFGFLADYVAAAPDGGSRSSSPQHDRDSRDETDGTPSDPWSDFDP